MRAAIALARRGVTAGDGGPFGAVVVREGRILGRGWNRVIVDRDPTAHAEMAAIRDACRRLRVFHLEGCTLYSACEPCPMCLAAAYWARIPRIVYGAGAADAAALGFDDRRILRVLTASDEGLGLHMEQTMREQALDVFRLWRDSPLRVDY
jgi:tRNA(Arg) A34 adenosine deaminase TadA